MKQIDDYVFIQDLSSLNPDMKSSYPFGRRKSERGDMIYLNSQEQLSLLGVLELRPELGSRGRHMHLTKKEYFYFINGEVKGHYWFEEAPETIQKISHYSGQLVTIMPGIFHEFFAIKPSWAVEFSPSSYDARDTVYPCAVNK